MRVRRRRDQRDASASRRARDKLPAVDRAGRRAAARAELPGRCARRAAAPGAGRASRRSARSPRRWPNNALARHGNPYPRGDVRHARSFDEMARRREGGDGRAADAPSTRASTARRMRSSAPAATSTSPRCAQALEQAFGGWKSGERVRARAARRWCRVTPAALRDAHARQAERDAAGAPCRCR